MPRKSTPKTLHEQKIAQLIEVVSAIPPDKNLPEIETVLQSEMQKQIEKGMIDEIAWIYAMDNALAFCLKDLPDSFRVHAWQISERFAGDTQSKLEHAVSWYINFRSDSHTLRGIARLNKLAPQIPKRISWILHSIGVTLESDDVDRIRSCAICNQVFWAARRDKKCCSGACANVYRVRLSRERERDKYRQDPIGYVKKQADREGQNKSKAKKPKQKGR